MTNARALDGPIAAWHLEHECFRRLLQRLQHEVDRFHGAERPNYELMYDIVSYLRDYGDLFTTRARTSRSRGSDGNVPT